MVRIIDFHAGYCNQKRAFAHYLKDDASAIFGTHTYVQTADEAILYNKLGYMTDIGMCGPINSTIGYDLILKQEDWWRNCQMIQFYHHTQIV